MGIAALEDKIVQQAVVTILNQIYEVDFKGFSYGMALLLIAHDPGVVAYLADRVVVMYRGKVMEMGPLAVLYRNPQHPYLQRVWNRAVASDPRLAAWEFSELGYGVAFAIRRQA